MSYAQYLAVNGYHWTQWVVFGGHVIIASLFGAGAIATLQSGGRPGGAAVLGLLASLVVLLGLVVARMMGRD
jgi:hypothetical protein